MLYPGHGDYGTRLREAFGPLSYVHLSRVDKVAHAGMRIAILSSSLSDLTRIRNNITNSLL